MINKMLISNMQFSTIVGVMVIKERENALTHEYLSVQDVVIDHVAAVHHKQAINDQSRADAILATGIGLIGWEAVISPELVLGDAVNDESTAVALAIGSQIHESPRIVQVVV